MAAVVVEKNLTEEDLDRILNETIQSLSDDETIEEKKIQEDKKKLTEIAHELMNKYEVIKRKLIVKSEQRENHIKDRLKLIRDVNDKNFHEFEKLAKEAIQKMAKNHGKPITPDNIQLIQKYVDLLGAYFTILLEHFTLLSQVLKSLNNMPQKYIEIKLYVCGFKLKEILHIINKNTFLTKEGLNQYPTNNNLLNEINKFHNIMKDYFEDLFNTINKLLGKDFERRFNLFLTDSKRVSKLTKTTDTFFIGQEHITQFSDELSNIITDSIKSIQETNLKKIRSEDPKINRLMEMFCQTNAYRCEQQFKMNFDNLNSIIIGGRGTLFALTVLFHQEHAFKRTLQELNTKMEFLINFFHSKEPAELPTLTEANMSQIIETLSKPEQVAQDKKILREQESTRREARARLAAVEAAKKKEEALVKMKKVDEENSKKHVLKEALFASIVKLDNAKGSLFERIIKERNALHEVIDLNDFLNLIQNLAGFYAKPTKKGIFLFFDGKALTGFHNPHGTKVIGPVIAAFNKKLDALEITSEKISEVRSSKKTNRIAANNGAGA